MLEKKPAKTIGKYELIGKIAQGGMGALYKARHPTLDRVVLLKKLTLKGGSQFVERFKREARLMMDFKNDHIVHVYDHFKEGSSYYIVEEFVDGLSLDALIRRERYLSNEAAMLILYEVCKALKYAHDKQVIHRDIKPGNILISTQGEVKLVDFGIATSLEETKEGLTRDGTLLGTPSYIPPEQIEDAKNVDKRADIYSVGVVLYEMLTGKTPFPGSFTAETISLIHKGRYTPPHRLNPRISPVLRTIVRKAMRARPRRRYQDLQGIIRILERRIRRRDALSIQQSIRKVLAAEDIADAFRKRRRWVAPLAAGLVLASVVGAGGYCLSRQGFYHEYFAADRYGALIASVWISTGYKEPGEIYVKPVLFRERDNELVAVEGIDMRFHENRSRRSEGGFSLESEKWYLEAGSYRLKVNLEGELYWNAFYLNPRAVQRQALATASAQEISIDFASGPRLPLQIERAVYDIDTGQDLTGSAAFSVYVDESWLTWDPSVAEKLRSGATYRFRFEHEGYYSRTYNLAIKPYQPFLHLEAELIPFSGILQVRSNAGGLRVLLNDSGFFFTGGRDRQYRKLEPLQAGSQDIELNPGQYQLTVQRDASISRTLTITVRSGETAIVQVDYDAGRRLLDMVTLE